MTNFSCQPLLDRLTHVLTKANKIKAFKSMYSLEEKIKFILSNKEIIYDEKIIFIINKEITNLLEVLYEAPNKCRKRDELGEDFKSRGSKAYLKKRDSEAHKLYTEGLRLTPSDSRLLPLLYANRSATLFQMKLYEECLLDIQRAEENGYPIENQHKLAKRKIESYIKLGEKIQALNSLQVAEKKIEDNPVTSQEAKNNLKKSMESLEVLIKNMELSNNEIKSRISKDYCNGLFMGESSSVSQMCAALNLRVNSKDGRHITANINVPKGSVIFKEKPFASILLPEYFLTHCQNCLVATMNPIPCDECTDIIWCSEKCKVAGNIFHQHECNILHILSGVGIAHLALRIVLVAGGWKTCSKIRKELESEEVKINADTFQYGDKESRYKAVYSLLTHLNETVAEDQFQYALAAVILGKAVLKKKISLNEFSSDSEEQGDDVLVDLCCIIMHHIAQLVSNAHAITQVNESNEGESSNICNVAQKRIASAIYPSASLMNHSCMPAIINCFHNDELVIHTINEIKAGQQVYNCYGPHANRQDRKERQSVLSRQYFFKCECPPCIEDSYLIKEASWSGIICPKCSGVAVWEEEQKSSDSGVMKCLQCKINAEPPSDIIEKCSTANQLFQDGEEAILDGNLIDAEIYLSDALQVGVQVYVKNNHFLNTIEDTLAKVLASQGKFNKALSHLSSCMEAVKSRYGEDSIEVAHELVKYQDIMKALPYQESRMEEIEKINKKIKEIFSTHFGPDWKRFYSKMQPL